MTEETNDFSAIITDSDVHFVESRSVGFFRADICGVSTADLQYRPFSFDGCGSRNFTRMMVATQVCNWWEGTERGEKLFDVLQTSTKAVVERFVPTRFVDIFFPWVEDGVMSDHNAT